MKAVTTILCTLSITVLCITGTSAQQVPGLQKKKEFNFYKQSLKVDSAKAVEIAGIMNVYKTGMRILEEDTALTQDVRRERFKALIDEKNKKLRAVLNTEQQAKAIPTSEQNLSKDENKAKH